MSAHTCPAPGCTRQVAVDMLACRDHWFQLPRGLRNAVWRAYRGPGPGSPEHTEAITAAVTYLHARP